VVTRLHALLVEGAAIAVHCRQGIGRSSLVVASVLVASGVGPEEAWRRVSEARGREVPDTAAQRAWLYALAEMS
jgi:protein-tyrosine phosphatase